jgi:hypothetical protein
MRWQFNNDIKDKIYISPRAVAVLDEGSADGELEDGRADPG